MLSKLRCEPTNAKKKKNTPTTKKKLSKQVDCIVLDGIVRVCPMCETEQRTSQIRAPFNSLQVPHNCDNGKLLPCVWYIKSSGVAVGLSQIQMCSEHCKIQFAAKCYKPRNILTFPLTSRAASPDALMSLKHQNKRLMFGF